MFSFSADQKVQEIHGIPFGGQPGRHPTVLIGTLFYGNQFRSFETADRDRAAFLIQDQERMSDITGNPAIVDIFIESSDHIRRNIEFTLDHISDNLPFLVDIPEADVRMDTLKYLDEAGLLPRTIYNSINLGLVPEEFELLKVHPPAGAILLGYNPKDFSADGRIDILDTGAGMLEKGIIEYAEEAGIEGKLLDTAAVPFGHNAAETIRAIPVMKNRWGLPVGCSFHNTVESWSWLQEHKKENPEAYRLCDVASNGLVISFGGSFVLYGPIESAPLVFPYAAMIDKVVSEGAEDYFGVVPAEGHPRTRLQ
jgi:tetrahydromethanopterin S-methyltransferase subunit H